jgi:hypothetical protein
MEQAHSEAGYLAASSPALGGRDGALRRPRVASLGTACPQVVDELRGEGAPAPRSRVTQRAVPAIFGWPLLWLNLVCLDAPLVALAWQWLFAKTFGVAVSPAASAALFLTAWFIYLADRMGDCYSLAPGIPRSVRQQFCSRHQRIWAGLLIVIVGMDAWLILGKLEAETRALGAIIGVLAVVYLVLNHSLGKIWRALPLKELSIGALFSSGVLIGVLPAFRASGGSILLPSLLFTWLCTLNCVSIAVWERELDATQKRVSLATRWRRLPRHLGTMAFSLAVASLVAGVIHPTALAVYFCIGLSAVLLGALESGSFRVSRDEQTALADLFLLTPLIVLIAGYA